MPLYNGLSRAQLSYEYLHTNSTTHEFLFGALAELLDNARDASATKIDIFAAENKNVRGGFLLCFLDDGEGMDPNETSSIITFGKSTKRSEDSQKIGMYGNGLKSGSMRIGNDLIVFTKKGPTMSCLFLSRTFHEEEEIDEVIVPLPSFETSTRRPLTKGPRCHEKHVMEMSLILKYSPYKSEDEFLAEFDKITGSSGTLVIVYNVKLLDSGEPELDIKTDFTDIRLSNPPNGEIDSEHGLMPEKRSFRLYASILYIDPRMKVYIQGKKVRTKRLTSALYKPRMYKYSSNRFKTRAEFEARKSLDDALGTENRALEAESKAKNLENRFGSSLTKDQRIELRKCQTIAAEYRKDAQIKKQMSDRKMKSLRDPKTLGLIFGMNIENRSHDGVFVYNCSRLIRMYEKVGPQTDGGVYCNGVVGIVDIPYLVLEPTHNKQDFADAKEYRHLLRIMGEHMIQYWKDVGIAQQGVTKFWENFGYISGNWKDPPSEDPKYTRKRAMQVNVTLQCDVCLKWRSLPFAANNIGRDFDDDWACRMNPESSHSRCSAAEQKLNIPEGVMKRESRTVEEREKKLEEEIRKKQELLQKMQKMKPVMSSAQLRKMEEEKRRQEEEEEEKLEAEAARKEKEREKQRIQKEREKEQQRKEQERERQRKDQEKERVRKEREKEQQRKEKEKEKEQMRKDKEKEKEQQRKDKEKEQQKKEKEKQKEIDRKEREKEQQRIAREKEKKEREKEKEKKEKEKQKEIEKKEREKEKQRLEEEREREKQKKEEQRTAKKQSAAVISPATAVTTTTRTSRTSLASNLQQMSDDESLPSPPLPSKFAETTGKRKVANKITSAKTDEEEDEEDEPPVKQARVNSTTNVKDSEPEMTEEEPMGVVEYGIDSMAVESTEEEQIEEQTPASTSVDQPEGDVGAHVEGRVSDKWYSGVVVKVNNAEGKWKVKFDHHPRDKFDLWYDKNGSDIKVVKSANQLSVESTVTQPASPSSNSHDGTVEAPTSSTGAVATLNAEAVQVTEDIANGYRTCLRYFLPPQWVMDKESISGLPLTDLASFPLDDFFDHYEKGLRKLVNNFQNEANASRNNLSSLRKNIARLLRSLNDEFDIDPEDDTEGVDELLAACVNQATLGK